MAGRRGQRPEAATADEDLISRLDAIESLGRHVQQEPRVRAVLADLARHDPSVEVRPLAAATLGSLE
jgi:hypothetical protein